MLQHIRSSRTLLLMLTALSLDAQAGPPRLDGEWGGPGLRLTADAQLVRLEGECWNGSTAAAVELDAQGRFAAQARIEHGLPGRAPQVEEPGASIGTARISGRLEGGRLHLTVTPAVGMPHSHTLTPNAPVKLIRCL